MHAAEPFPSSGSCIERTWNAIRETPQRLYNEASQTVRWLGRKIEPYIPTMTIIAKMAMKAMVVFALTRALLCIVPIPWFIAYGLVGIGELIYHRNTRFSYAFTVLPIHGVVQHIRLLAIGPCSLPLGLLSIASILCYVFSLTHRIPAHYQDELSISRSHV